MANSATAPVRLASTLGDRIGIALGQSGRDAEWLAAQLQREKRSVNLWLLGNTYPSPQSLLAIAVHCHVDVRWLAVGQHSRAGVAAADHAWRYLCSRGHLLSQERDSLIAFLARTPEPDAGLGVCRYCRCVDARACPDGCSWIDREETICSACLRSPSEEVPRPAG